MTFSVTRRHPLFFAEIGGVDLTRPMTAAQFAPIEAAFNENAALLFRDQFVTGAQHVAFSEFFGPVFTATKYGWRDVRPRLRP